MRRVESLDDAGQAVDLAPHRQRIAFADLDLVAHAPGEQGRMIAVALDEGAEVALLRRHRRGVVDAEAVARMCDPQPHHHLQAEARRLVEHPGVGVVVIDAHNPAAGGG